MDDHTGSFMAFGSLVNQQTQNKKQGKEDSINNIRQNILHNCPARIRSYLVLFLSFPGSVAWGRSWLTGKCSRAHASTLVFRLWACGRCCWKKVFSTMVRVCDVPAPHVRVTALKPCCPCLCCCAYSGPRAELPGQVPLLSLPG